MAYKYTPAYYSTLHDSITSLCKNVLPFSFKKRRLAATEHRLAKLQSDNLKWQQDSYHQILNLMGLHREGILAEHEVSTFRTHLLETLVASPPEIEHSVILRDKLLFLQELLYAKCITEEEYHSSKRPLLQRMAVQGAEIESRDVIVGTNQNKAKEDEENRDEEWSVIDLKDEKCLSAKEKTPLSKSKPSSSSMIKQQIKGAATMFGFHNSSSRRQSIFEIEANRSSCETEEVVKISVENGETKSILMQGSSLQTESARKKKDNGSSEKAKRKPFGTLFHHKEESGGAGTNSAKKKQWGLKWKRNNSEEDETSPLPLNFERLDEDDDGGYSNLVTSPIGEGPDTKQIKRKLHSNGTPSDFFIDKVLGNNIKKELSRIQTELATTNPNLKFSEDQIEAISTKLPVDKSDLNNFFPKSWCDRYGEVVLDVVKKEFKDHVSEMENMRNANREKNLNNSKRWTTFDVDDDENSHPNHNNNNNPFLHDCSSNKHGNDPRAVSSSFQNPFWNAASH